MCRRNQQQLRLTSNITCLSININWIPEASSHLWQMQQLVYLHQQSWQLRIMPPFGTFCDADWRFCRPPNFIYKYLWGVNWLMELDQEIKIECTWKVGLNISWCSICSFEQIFFSLEFLESIFGCLMLLPEIKTIKSSILVLILNKQSCDKKLTFIYFMFT